LFKRGERVAIGASGGKDSTVLAYVLKLLNERYDYGLDLFLLSIDEGIQGYRDDSLETVKRNQQQYDLPLKILSYAELYDWTMDDVVRVTGLKGNCTFCGVFRRQALDRGAEIVKADKVVTGHNADDVAETVLLNLLRGDIPRLQRCTSITTGAEGSMPRCKPFKYVYEKEIVMYAHFKKLDYFSTECIYSPNAYRGFARDFLKKLEVHDPGTILDIIHSGESFEFDSEMKMPVQGVCERCGYISSQPVCKACQMLDELAQRRGKRGPVAVAYQEDESSPSTDNVESSRSHEHGDHEHEHGDRGDRDSDRVDRDHPGDRANRGRSDGGRGADRDGTRLLVRNLNLRSSVEDIRGHFSRYGSVRDVFLPLDYESKQPKGFGFVEFENYADARDAQEALDHRELDGREITVEFAAQLRKAPDLASMAAVSGGGAGV